MSAHFGATYVTDIGAVWLPTTHNDIGAFQQAANTVGGRGWGFQDVGFGYYLDGWSFESISTAVFVAPAAPPAPSVVAVDITPNFLDTGLQLTVANLVLHPSTGNALAIGTVVQAITSEALSGGNGTITYTFLSRGPTPTSLKLGVSVTLSLNSGEATTSVTPQARTAYSYVNMGASINANVSQGVAFYAPFTMVVSDQVEYETLGGVISIDDASQVVATAGYAALADPGTGAPAIFNVYYYDLSATTWFGPVTFALTPDGSPFVVASTGNPSGTPVFLGRGILSQGRGRRRWTR